MRRLTKLATMISLMLLGLLLLASDSVEENFYFTDVTTNLTYQGDLFVSGKITVRDDDGDDIDLLPEYLTVDVEVYRINSETEDENGYLVRDETLIFSLDDHPFNLRGNLLDVVLIDRDIRIIDETQETKFRVELRLHFDNDVKQYNTFDTEYYLFTPEDI